MTITKVEMNHQRARVRSRPSAWRSPRTRRKKSRFLNPRSMSQATWPSRCSCLLSRLLRSPVASLDPTSAPLSPSSSFLRKTCAFYGCQRALLDRVWVGLSAFLGITSGNPCGDTRKCEFVLIVVLAEVLTRCRISLLPVGNSVMPSTASESCLLVSPATSC
jgi:hypothetical protein